MRTREIPRDEWLSFFDEFSRQHEGWLVTVEVLAGESGAQLEAHDLPLVGITTDSHGNSETIAIIVGQTIDDHVTHTISEPAQVWLEETDEGAHQALQIESANEKTIIRFRSAVPTELVDGVVMEPVGR